VQLLRYACFRYESPIFQRYFCFVSGTAFGLHIRRAINQFVVDCCVDYDEHHRNINKLYGTTDNFFHDHNNSRSVYKQFYNSDTNVHYDYCRVDFEQHYHHGNYAIYQQYYNSGTVDVDDCNYRFDVFWTSYCVASQSI
jgi:hypothetical protein